MCICGWKMDCSSIVCYCVTIFINSFYSKSECTACYWCCCRKIIKFKMMKCWYANCYSSWSWKNCTIWNSYSSYWWTSCFKSNSISECMRTIIRWNKSVIWRRKFSLWIIGSKCYCSVIITYNIIPHIFCNHSKWNIITYCHIQTW